MPELSRFFGISIVMYYNDHEPPYFHVRYGDQKAVIGIEPLSLTDGELSPRVMGLVMEWASMHKSELVENWKLAKEKAPLKKIEPLE